MIFCKPKTCLECCRLRLLFLLTRVAAADARLVSIDLPGGPGGGGYPAWKIPLFEEFPLPDQRVELAA
jgi:hypothetical protein